MSEAVDPFDLARFMTAQSPIYSRVLAEIKNGRKQSHWMWFIFPQFVGLGSSETARRYAIKSIEEARDYLENPILGPRLMEWAEAALAVEGKTAHDIFGSPDDLKLRSCATLFAHISSAGSPFQRLLEKYFAGEGDEKTLELLRLV